MIQILWLHYFLSQSSSPPPAKYWRCYELWCVSGEGVWARCWRTSLIKASLHPRRRWLRCCWSLCLLQHRWGLHVFGGTDGWYRNTISCPVHPLRLKGISKMECCPFYHPERGTHFLHEFLSCVFTICKASCSQRLMCLDDLWWWLSGTFEAHPISGFSFSFLVIYGTFDEFSLSADMFHNCQNFDWSGISEK